MIRRHRMSQRRVSRRTLVKGAVGGALVTPAGTTQARQQELALTLNLYLVDFMDQRPLPGAGVDVEMWAYPVFPRVPDEDDPEPEDESPPVPDFGQRIEFSQTGTSNSDGLASFVFDTTDAFEQLTGASNDQGLPALHVRALFFAHLTFFGASYHRRKVAEDLSIGAEHEYFLPVDLGMSIVGHTTPTTTRLWFHLPIMPVVSLPIKCTVFEESPAEASGGEPDQTANSRTFPVEFDVNTRTAVVDVDGITPGALSHYALDVPIDLRTDFAFVKGTVKTPSPPSLRLRFAFGSCHLPTVGKLVEPTEEEALRTLERWQYLNDLPDEESPEFLLLMGDQIYGDYIEDKWPDLDPLAQFVRRYEQLWVHRPQREVLRKLPTYMILDDHDVADDFGVVNLDDQKVVAALECYQRFQHSHNPGGPGPVGGPFHYSFNWGPAAFFVMDGRTSRGTGYPESPVFGQTQLADLKAWSVSPETRAADVIFFVAPIPLAVLATQLILDLAEKFAEELGAKVGAALGTIVGAVVGSGLGGPLGGAVGAGLGALVFGAAGYEAGEEIYEQYLQDSLLVEADLTEAWDRKENQPELGRLLTLLFELANGIGDDPPKPRAVFILSGDIHAGTMHGIRALPIPDRPDYQRNPLILQLTSSALSHEPVNSELFTAAVSHITDDLDIGLKDVAGLLISSAVENWVGVGDGSIDVNDLFDPGAAAFRLDPDQDGQFLAQFSGLLLERNVGRVNLELLNPEERVYRCHLHIEGAQDGLHSSFDLDLDANVIQPYGYGAAITSVNAPGTVAAYGSFEATVTVRNTGTATWIADGGCALDVIDELWNLDKVPLDERVASGASTTFELRLIAPGPGRFPLNCRMTIGDTRFGDTPSTVYITATTDDACEDLLASKQVVQEKLEGLRAYWYTLPEGSAESKRVEREMEALSQQLAGIQSELDRLGCD